MQGIQDGRPVHDNVLRMYGYVVDAPPYILVLELCFTNLSRYLRQLRLSVGNTSIRALFSWCKPFISVFGEKISIIPRQFLVSDQVTLLLQIDNKTLSPNDILLGHSEDTTPRTPCNTLITAQGDPATSVPARY